MPALVPLRPLLLLLALGACVPTTTAEQSVGRTPITIIPPAPAAGLEGVIGRSADALTAAFGKPDLDLVEGSARKLQFSGPACVLDAYLYAPARGKAAVVTHVDARLPDGRDVDRASCVAALAAKQSIR